MTELLAFKQTWRGYWSLTKHRPEPWWARMLVTASIGLVFALAFTLINGVLSKRLGAPQVMLNIFTANLLLSLSIAYTIHALNWGLERVLPAAWIETINRWRDWRSGLLFSLVGVLGASLGFQLGLWLVGQVPHNAALKAFANGPQDMGSFWLFTGLITLGNWIWWRARGQQQALRLRATEARLLHLQAQIEPHFLFNSLAAVQSLIKPAPDRALAMLEHFTDHLRASLNAMREDSCQLGTELQAVRSYLALMQIRMGDRLRYQMEVAPEAEPLRLPPLLIQPLVENAIVHGIEPKDEGGEVRLHTWVEGSTLKVLVQDDGLGLLAKPRPGRQGHGIALQNVRERLATRYGERAALDVQIDENGCRALLTLPINPNDQGSAA